MDKTAIRDAATVIVVKHGASPQVLMGQRGASAAFMPNKFVFPGGAVDDNDATVPISALSNDTLHDLQVESDRPAAALAAAAIRELWEETGLILGHPSAWDHAPQGWRGFAETGHVPHAAALQYFFRAVTPQGRPRRFDARFFLADAAHIANDIDDFSRAEDELSYLQWIPLDEVRRFDLPFITQVVLAELIQHLQNPSDRSDIPFFRNDDEAHLVTRLGGRSPL